MRLIVFSMVAIFLISCGKEGCKDPLATNYDSSAKKEDNSCLYCFTDQVLDDSRGSCDQTLIYSSFLMKPLRVIIEL